jgi:microcystin degradation protein MlrC
MEVPAVTRRVQGSGGPRIGVVAIYQESNTFAPGRATLADFEAQGIYVGEELDRLRGSNTEAAGALEALHRREVQPVPILRAFAMPSGALTADASASLGRLLADRLAAARPLDGLVMALHGALAAEDRDSVDAGLIADARSIVGPDVPIGVCFDLHANVTREMVESATFVIGYHTNPHVDQAATGARTADLVVDSVAGIRRPSTALAKRPMLVPAETMATSERPMADLRSLADRRTTGPILDVSLFPVQPWLDVDQLGFGVLVTADADHARAQGVADELAQLAWDARGGFRIDLVSPAEALSRARSSPVRPFVLAESADAPTAGAPGDSAAMITAALAHGAGLRIQLTIADAPAVERCHAAGAGAHLELRLGASVERRVHPPVDLRAEVVRLGDAPTTLTGPVLTGQEVSMGRWAVVRAGGLSVLVTERPGWTADSATYEQVGLPLSEADVVVVRSCYLYRAAYGRSGAHALTLDLPGPSTPRLDRLAFRRAPRPLYPLDLV